MFLFFDYMTMIKKVVGVLFNFFQLAIIITVYLKSILKQGYYENFIKQKLVYNAIFFLFWPNHTN